MTTRLITRYLAVPAVCAGILGGAALGLAGLANAGTYSYQPTPRPGIVAKPDTIARPPVFIPRHHRYDGPAFIITAPAG